jgi:hypothetical protein
LEVERAERHPEQGIGRHRDHLTSTDDHVAVLAAHLRPDVAVGRVTLDDRPLRVADRIDLEQGLIASSFDTGREPETKKHLDLRA